MPVYEYLCAACSRPHDELRSFGNADKPAICPFCGATKSRRLLPIRFYAITGSRAATSGCAGCKPSPAACGACRGARR